MNKDHQKPPENKSKKKKDKDINKEQLEKKIDKELEQSFPASDPPSYSQPGNDDIKSRS